MPNTSDVRDLATNPCPLFQPFRLCFRAWVGVWVGGGRVQAPHRNFKLPPPPPTFPWDPAHTGMGQEAWQWSVDSHMMSNIALK
eukprot:366501-Chlamydomonas_euryale.AAC.17